MILSVVCVLVFANIHTSRAACHSLHSVVNPCSEKDVTGDVIYFDTSNTYSMNGTCMCYIQVDPTPLDVNITVESGPEHCDAVLNFTTLNYAISCVETPPPLSASLGGAVYISWVKNKTDRSTDVCVRIEKAHHNTEGTLTLHCLDEGEIVQAKDDRWVLSTTDSSAVTTTPGQSETTSQKLAKIFESYIVVGILAGIVIFLFILGLIVYCDENRIKEREAKAQALIEQRRRAKIEALQRMRPPRRKEVVETKL